jgi:hypothetical protein
MSLDYTHGPCFLCGKKKVFERTILVRQWNRMCAVSLCTDHMNLTYAKLEKAIIEAYQRL